MNFFYYEIDITMCIWINEHLHLARMKNRQIIYWPPEADPEKLSLEKWFIQAEKECLKVIQARIKRLLFLAKNWRLEGILNWSLNSMCEKKDVI